MGERTGSSRVRVAIVDDHPMVREGTRALLERSDAIVVVGIAGEGAAALRLAQQLRPDVLLLDVRLPDMSGIEVARQLRATCPEVKVLVVTGYDEIGYSRALLQLGVHGYLPKSASGAQIISSILTIAAGERLRPGAATHTGVVRDRVELTMRELDVLRLLLTGRRNAQIAEELCVSLKTVEFHLRNIFLKLGASSRAEAVCIALQEGICVPEDYPERIREP